MKRYFAVLVAIGFLWTGTAIAAINCGIFVYKRGVNSAKYFPGDSQASFDAAKAHAYPNGWIQIGPGCDFINIGTLSDSVSVMRFDGNEIKWQGKQQIWYDRAGVERFKVDSLGFAVTEVDFGTNPIIAIQAGGYSLSAFPGTQTGIEDALTFGGPGADIIISPVNLSSTATIRILNDNVKITGVSDSSSLFTNAAVTGDTLFHIFGKNVTIRNIGVVGDKSNKATGVGVVIDGTDALVENCAFRDLNQKGLIVNSGGVRSKVRGNKFTRIGDSGDVSSYGIFLNGASNASVDGNTIIENASPAIVMVNSANNLIHYNRILSTISSNSSGHGIKADSTNVKVVVTNNLLESIKGFAIDMEADSSMVDGNSIYFSFAGIHAHGAFGASSVINNFVSNTQAYGLYYESVESSNFGSRWAGNTVINPGFNCIHAESQIQANGDVVIENNYCYGGVNNTLSGIRALTVAGGTWNRLVIKNNHIYSPKKHGIEFLIVSGELNAFVDAVVTGNEIFYPAQYGILTPAMPDTSNAYISDNTVIGAGIGELSLSPTNWTYEGSFMKHTKQGSTVIASDSLRVGAPTTKGTLTVSGKAVVSDSLRANLGIRTARDISVDPSGNKVTFSGSGAKLIEATDAASSIRLNAGSGIQRLEANTSGVDITNGRLLAQDSLRVNKTTDLVGGVNIGQGSSIKFFRNAFGYVSSIRLDSGDDLQFAPVTSSDAIEFRDAADSRNNLSITNAGDVFAFNSILPGTQVFANLGTPANGTVTYCSDCTPAAPTAGGGSGAIVARENGVWNGRSGAGSGEVNTASNVGSGDGLLFKQKSGVDLEFKRLADGTNIDVTNGVSDVTVALRDKVTILDSLRVIGKLDVGRKNGVPQVHTIGAGGTATADSVTLILNGGGTSGGGDDTPKIVFQRDGDTEATLDVDLNNTSLRIQDGDFFRIGKVGAVPFNTFTVNSDGWIEVGSGIPTAPLEINGHGFLTDSLRVNKGITTAGNITIDPPGDRLTFNGTGNKLITATHGSGVVRIAAAGGLQKFEANSAGVSISGALDVSTKATIADSARFNKGFYAGGQLVNKILRNSASLNFDLTVNATHDLTISVPGAAVGDECFLGIPAAAVVAGVIYSQPWVSATDVVTVRAARTCDTAPDPTTGTFKVVVYK